MRKKEKKQRVRRWGAIMLAGAATAAAGWWAIGPAAAVVAVVAAAAIGHRQMIGPRGIPILTYHSVSPDPAWLPWSKEISVHPATFERHLQTLKRMGCTAMRSIDVVEARRRGEEPPRGAVVLHFDDGYLDNWLFALPSLRRHRMPATFFVSLDFIAPGDRPRTAEEGDCSGYMNWAELKAIDADSLFDVEPHGIDHGRVPVSGRAVGRLTRENWRSLAWMQWAATPGPKHDWYRAREPVAVPLGSPVPESEGALAAPAYVGGVRESDDAFRERVRSTLSTCRDAFAERLGREPNLFCWPENRVCETGREVAAELGYAATTAGAARNGAGEPASVLSRIHVGDRALGFRFGPAESLRLRAAVRMFEGNHYWYLVAAPMDLTRRIVMALRGRMGIPFA